MEIKPVNQVFFQNKKCAAIRLHVRKVWGEMQKREGIMKKQMKKTLSVLLILSLITIMAIPVMAKDNGTWTLEQSVDDFGDKSGNPVIQSEVTGTFSNTATSESDLKVIAYIISDDTGTIVGEGKYVLAFRLFEYGDHVATYISSDDKIFKTKIGDTVNEYELSGSAPNGDLYVDVNTTVSELNTAEDIDNYISGQNSNYGEAIAKQLVDGNDIKCVIKIGSSKYNFVLESGNIKDVFDELMQDGNHSLPQDIEGQEVRQQNQETAKQEQNELEKSQAAEDYYKSMRNFLLSVTTGEPQRIDAYENNYLNAHYTEYPILTQEELTTTFSGQYLIYSLGIGATLDGEYVNLAEDGNEHLLGYYRANDNSFQSREDFNPNVEEIQGSWKIEDGKLTIPGMGPNGDSYEIRDTGYNGYYLMSYWSKKTGTSDAPSKLIVATDDNQNLLYSLPDE